MSTLFLVSTGRDTANYTLKAIFRDRQSAENLYQAIEKVCDQTGDDYPDDIEEIELDETSDYCCKQYWTHTVFVDNSESFHPKGEIITGWEPASSQRDFALKLFPYRGRQVARITSYVSKTHLNQLIKGQLWLKPGITA
jgi:hypothetical protein